MRIATMIFLMLIVFLMTSTLQLSCTAQMGCSNLSFGLALSLFFGTMVAIPVVLFLFLFDLISTRLRFPLSSLVYVALSVLCCATVAFLIAHGKGRPTPATVDEWLAALVEFSPVLTAACIPLARQIYRAAAVETSAR